GHGSLQVGGRAVVPSQDARGRRPGRHGRRSRQSLEARGGGAVRLEPGGAPSTGAPERRSRALRLRTAEPLPRLYRQHQRDSELDSRGLELEVERGIFGIPSSTSSSRTGCYRGPSMKQRTPRYLTLVVALIALPAAVFAGDWPMWGHDSTRNMVCGE